MVHIEAPWSILLKSFQCHLVQNHGETYDVMDDTETSTLLPFLAT
jgi:hypothetical protein